MTNMQEITWTTEQAIAFFVIMVPLLANLWRHLGKYTIETPEIEETPTKLTNEHYGAIIQSQGRYYN